MSIQRLTTGLAGTVALLVGLGLALVAGCPPVPQQPTVPTDEEPNTTVDTGNPNNGAIDRPIPPPVLDNDTTTVVGDDPTGGQPPINPPQGGGGGGSGQFVFINVSGPGSNLRVRPGTNVAVTFEFQDTQGAAQTIELLIARDDDSNNEADGAPVQTLGITAVAGSNTFQFDTNNAVGLLTNGFGRFVFGVRVTTLNNTVFQDYSSGSVVIDTTAPTATWVSPQPDNLSNRVSAWPISVQTIDNSPLTVRVLLDPDTIPQSGNEFELLPATNIGGGTVTSNFSPSLLAFPVGTYNYYVIASDGIEPAFAFYAQRTPGDLIKLRLTNRLIGDFALSTLANNSTQGAIFQGFNFNDLAGSSIRSVPDIDGDGTDELLVSSRFGKAHIIEYQGVGFGEAYMIYGGGQRLSGSKPLNSVGGLTPGLIFPGIRTPRNAPGQPQNASTRWTAGLSDINVIPDMDGDELPELVFSFPRVESINLGETSPLVQHPDLVPDLPSMGNLEFNAWNPAFQTWVKNTAQFTRGGLVIVSSQNEMLQNRTLLNRKSNRVIDLHEVGQLFTNMSRPGLVPYIRTAFPRPMDETGGFIICADCDLLPPDGCVEGTLAEAQDIWDEDPNQIPDGCGYPNDPNWPTDVDCGAVAGNCGDDGCAILPGEELDGKEREIQRWIVQWDTVFNNQGPGGFLQSWTAIPVDPPLANASPFPFQPPAFPFSFYPNRWVPGLACATIGGDSGCEVTNEWYVWGPPPFGPPFPGGGQSLIGTPAWATEGNPTQTLPKCYPSNPCITLVTPEDGECPEPDAPPPCENPDIDVEAGGSIVWTGFYGPETYAYTSSTSGTFPSPMGARVLGQKVDDLFGAALGSDGTWLYISAPERTANDAPYGTDIPSLAGTRNNSGVVYQLRTNAPLPPDGITRTQLWMERGTRTIQDPNNPNDPNALITVLLGWPNIDAQLPGRVDYTMPVPHQYIIETIGSIRGNPAIGIHETAFGDPQQDSCPPGYDPGNDQPDADALYNYTPYPTGTAGYYVDRTPQIVGPHAQAKIEFVRGLGDVNGDGVRDFAVGSDKIKANVAQGTGDTVGAIFVVYGRQPGVEGDYLLEQLSFDRSDPNRLNGVLIKGSSAGENLARTFTDAGDFNNDGYADVLIGNENAASATGEAILVFGSPTLLSPGPNDEGGTPGGGWTPATIPADRAIRFRGAVVGQRAGANVSAAGDVDNDGYSDLLIAAPGDDNGRGAVYLIYGGPDGSLPSEVLLGDLSLNNIDVPYVKFNGRGASDFLGGGAKTISNTTPDGGSTLAFSQGLAPLGDIDGDGNADFALSAMLADPGSKTDAGEIYILYGRTGP